MLTKADKQQLAIKFGEDEKNTGSVEFQVAVLTEEIKLLTAHFKNNKKDMHSKVGLYKKISRRKSLLKYLRDQSYDDYIQLINSLGIRQIK